MIRAIFLIFIINSYLLTATMQEGEFVKQKQELIKLKQELDEFYKTKEQEYIKNKADLVKVEKKIQNNLTDIENAKNANQKILNEINKTIKSKVITLYGKMKLKVVLDILNEKIQVGQINEVFDIIVRLKDKRVMNLLKKFDKKTSTKLMDMLNNYKKEKVNG